MSVGPRNASAGCKLIILPDDNGKISLEGIEPYLEDIGVQHRVQPKVISITQSTELGTIYQPEEVRAIADFAHKHGMYLHMDGARIANAAAALGMSLKAATRDLGVDLLSFGGTKNGLLGGEAVVFFHPQLAKDFALSANRGCSWPPRCVMSLRNSSRCFPMTFG